MGLTSVMQSRRDVDIRSPRFPDVRDGRFDGIVRSELGVGRVQGVEGSKAGEMASEWSAWVLGRTRRGRGFTYEVDIDHCFKGVFGEAADRCQAVGAGSGTIVKSVNVLRARKRSS
jgi:hypothetical protein